MTRGLSVQGELRRRAIRLIAAATLGLSLATAAAAMLTATNTPRQSAPAVEEGLSWLALATSTLLLGGLAWTFARAWRDLAQDRRARRGLSGRVLTAVVALAGTGLTPAIAETPLSGGVVSAHQAIHPGDHATGSDQHVDDGQESEPGHPRDPVAAPVPSWVPRSDHPADHHNKHNEDTENNENNNNDEHEHGPPLPGWASDDDRPSADPQARLVVSGGSTDAIAEPVTVVVRAGDTLWSLAAAALGPGAAADDVAAAWPEWYAANRHIIGDDPHLILPGQLLTVPSTIDLAGA